MAENVQIEKTDRRSKHMQKVSKNKPISEEQVTIEQIRAAFRSTRLLNKKEQLIREKELQEIERKYGLEGLNNYLFKKYGLD